MPRKRSKNHIWEIIKETTAESTLGFYKADFKMLNEEVHYTYGYHKQKGNVRGLAGSAVYCCGDHLDCNHSYKIQPTGLLGLATLFRATNTCHISGAEIMPMKRCIHPTIKSKITKIFKWSRVRVSTLTLISFVF